MKKKFFLWMVPLVVIWLSCCQKELKWHLCGTVVEYGTGKPIPKATVNLGLHDPDTGSGGSSVYTKQVHADADGRFCHDVRVDVVGAEAEGYYPSGNQDIFIGENNREDWEVPLYPYAWVKITIRNETNIFWGIAAPSPTQQGKKYKLNKFEEFTFDYRVRGNLKNAILYGVYSSEFTPTNNHSDAKILLNDVQLVSDGGIGGSFAEFIPIGRDTSFIKIIY
jgi:hypothetical protein